MGYLTFKLIHKLSSYEKKSVVIFKTQAGEGVTIWAYLSLGCRSPCGKLIMNSFWFSIDAEESICIGDIFSEIKFFHF